MIDIKQLELDMEVALLNYGYSKQVVNIVNALKHYIENDIPEVQNIIDDDYTPDEDV